MIQDVDDTVGLVVGAAVGLAVGAAVGLAVGDRDGLAVGAAVGLAVGDKDGALDGVDVGDIVGKEVGLDVGVDVGDTVGERVAGVSGPPGQMAVHCVASPATNMKAVSVVVCIFCSSKHWSSCVMTVVDSVEDTSTALRDVESVMLVTVPIIPNTPGAVINVELNAISSGSYLIEILRVSNVMPSAEQTIVFNSKIIYPSTSGTCI